MSNGVQLGRKRSSHAISEDEELSDASTRDDSSNKRARQQTDASSRDANGDFADEDDGDEPHQPGSIVRISVKNFVTYAAAEFRPGPSLNMVIGPNGTGKSTLVCAICLGLGWDPKNLGRAKEIGEFVKHGSTEAKIEIELAAGEHDDSNVVIRRMITKKDNKSQFFLNGHRSSQKEVVRKAKSFSIQIDNLCQFLPQDRVVEFAGLTPVALLRETLRAAAPEEIVQQHVELIDLRACEKALEVEQQNEDISLKSLQSRQNAAKEDVQNYRERQALLFKQKALERTRPIIERNLLRKRAAELKEAKQRARQELLRMQAEAAPAQVAQNEMEAYRAQVEDVRNKRRALFDRTKREADNIGAQITAQKGAMTEFTNQLKGESSGNNQRKQEKARLEKIIDDLDRRMQEDPIEIDEQDYAARREELTRERLATADRNRTIENEVRGIRERTSNLRQQLQEKKNERAQLDTQTGMKASILQQANRDVAEGWKYIQDNWDRLNFKGDVFGPPLLTCSVTDTRFADCVEAQCRVSDLTAITCTHPDDQRLLSQRLSGRGQGCLGLEKITIKRITQPLAFYRSPATREELHELGFQGWILDYIQGPERVLAMLCESAQVHRTAFSSRELTDEQHTAATQSPIQAWIAGRDKVQISRRREYNQTSARVVGYGKAKYFTDQPVDVQLKQRLDEEMERIEQEIKRGQDDHQALMGQFNSQRDELRECKNQLENLDIEHRRLRKARAEWDALPEKKAEKQAELEDLNSILAETRSRVLQIKTGMAKASVKAASLAVDYQQAVSRIKEAHEALIEAEIRLIEATSEVVSLTEENQQLNETLAQLEQIVEESSRQYREVTDKFRRITNSTRELLLTLSEEEKAIMAEHSELATVEELFEKIDEVKTRLDLMAEGNPQAVEAYEQRARNIERTEAALAAIARKLEDNRAEIARIREEWEPKLDELVETISDSFSHNFSQIGCAGRVGVYKDADFAAWSIQIQVRFREQEALSILDSQRQSGGERAVSTIFYLMALQDLARSPFRVVDEINQGMDPRNERMVHERMVDIACKERTSQYFLITPKLLSGLKFHPKMKVHCIASGEHMPKNEGRLDFRKLAEKAIQSRMGVVG